MKSFLKNLRWVRILFLVWILFFLGGLLWQQYRSQTVWNGLVVENRAMLQSRYALAGKIITRDGVVLAQSLDGQRVYSEEPLLAEACMQIVGDYAHTISNSIESKYQDSLLGNDRNPFRQFYLDLLGKGIRGDDLILTLDSELQKVAYLGFKGARGAVVLLNYKTGEVLASVSAPSAHPEQVLRMENLPDSALVNRALAAHYAPGSTFKIITSAALLAQSDFDPEQKIFCAKKALIPHGANEKLGAGHGEEDLSKAFADSCNIYFGTRGAELGVENLQKEAEKWGWNQKRNLDRLQIETSYWSCPKDDHGLLSWASIGQPVGAIIEQTPVYQLAYEAALIARGGRAVQPHILLARQEPSEGKKSILLPKEDQGKEIISAQKAQMLQMLMSQTIKRGFLGDLQIEDYSMGAKSGTVQIDNQERANGLLAAYILDEQHPLAIGVVVEDRGSGAGQALRIARSVLAAALHRK